MRQKVLFIYTNRFADYPILFEYCVELKKIGYEIFYIAISQKEENFISEDGINVTHICKKI